MEDAAEVVVIDDVLSLQLRAIRDHYEATRKEFGALLSLIRRAPGAQTEDKKVAALRRSLYELAMLHDATAKAMMALGVGPEEFDLLRAEDGTLSDAAMHALVPPIIDSTCEEA